nr:MAG TPA: hypothetical protein [Caudoviricetes sp.]DAI19851.1 MAG TPA: hypothetical protein [Caudoviricetes sp.]
MFAVVWFSSLLDYYSSKKSIRCREGSSDARHITA